MSRMSLYASSGPSHQNSGRHARFGQHHNKGQLIPSHDSGSATSIMGSSASSSLMIDLNGYDQAIQELTESLNEVKLTAALALQESQLVREQMQQGILSVLSELSTMWCQDLCPAGDMAASPTESLAVGGGVGGGGSSGGGSSGSEDLRTNFRYKTQLCKNFMSGGVGRCAKGDNCQYAHGKPELRRICEHPRYKTKMCSLQIGLGLCPHGASCFFAHHPAELRSKEF